MTENVNYITGNRQDELCDLPLKHFHRPLVLSGLPSYAREFLFSQL